MNNVKAQGDFNIEIPKQESIMGSEGR